MKKRMKQRILAVLLMMGMLISLVGCAGGETGDKEPEQENEIDTPDPEQEGDTESASLLPYTGEEITFTYFWFDMGTDYSATETLPIPQVLQEKMGNIKLQLEVLPITDYYTKVPLLLAGGELPDIMIIPDPSTNLSTYGQNGIFLDWAPLMEEYMPNLYRYSQELAMFDGLRDTEGHTYGLPVYVNSEDYIMQTWLTNATLLEDLGIDIPETQDDFLEACRKVKAETGITPIQRRYGLASLMDSIGLMYKYEGDRGLSYYSEEGVWDFGPTREGSELKDFLTFMHTLWEEELIDHEINTMTEEQCTSYIRSGNFAFTNDYHESYSHAEGDSYVPFAETSEIEIEVIPTPVGTGGKVAVDSARDGKCVWAVVSDANTEHPELLAACIDLLFSEEIATYENYGIEGESYEIGDDGEKYFTDDVKAACNNFSGDISLADLGVNGNAWLRTFGITDTKAQRLLLERPEIYESVNDIIKKLDAGELEARYAYSYPALTEEENTELSDILTPVQTYLDECMMKFIIGDMDLEADWDTFMTKLQGYGDMERVCEILNSKEMPDYAGNWR